MAHADQALHGLLFFLKKKKTARCRAKLNNDMLKLDHNMTRTRRVQVEHVRVPTADRTTLH